MRRVLVVTDFHSGEPVSEHPTAEDVAAYLSGGLTPGDQAALEGHLAECRACRQQVTLARRLLRQRPAPNRLVWLVPAAAAAILAVVVVTRVPSPTSVGDEPLRADSGEAAVSIPIVAPRDGATLGPGPVVFSWQSQVGKPLYQFTLTDGGGRAIWTGATSDTVLTLPASVSLDHGRTYYWTVDALSADGRSLTTRNHRFSIAP